MFGGRLICGVGVGVYGCMGVDGKLNDKFNSAPESDLTSFGVIIFTFEVSFCAL